MKKLLIVGNPNSGKTTLFNMLASADEHVGNWHGVTVENKAKVIKSEDDEFLLIDTPGIYSLNPQSFEEQVTVDELSKDDGFKILNLCDKSYLRKNLYLTLCLLERNFDVMLIINKSDKKNTQKIDIKGFSDFLNIDILEINAEDKTERGKVLKLAKNCRRSAILPYYNDDFLRKSFQEKCKIRLNFVDFLLNKHTNKEFSRKKNNFDKIALNKWLGIPLFLLILMTFFYLTFFLIGGNLSRFFSEILTKISNPFLSLTKSWHVPWLTSFFEVAIFGGIETVLSFLPQVVLLFLFLSILEDSGYMSRVAFLFDDLFGKIGLSGKSVYSLLMGFGCSTTAIMTSRTADDEKSKIKTALMCPFLSCSAKIPIYVVVGGAFFGARNVFVIMGFYIFSLVCAISFSAIANKTILKSDKQSFVLEFPSYRTVSFKRVLKVLWKNTKEFVLRVGTVIVAVNVIMWVFSSFNFAFHYVVGCDEKSMLEIVGMVLSPIFKPLGFGSWAIVSVLICGFVAKEAIVSTIAMFNFVVSGEQNLIAKSILMPTSAVFFASKSAALSFLVFCLLYTPCMSSVIMLRSEVGKKWTLFSVVMQFVLAYVISFVVYNISFACEVFGGISVIGVLLLFASFCFSVVLVFRIVRKRKCVTCHGCDRHCKR